jgi:hypothetical protein
MPCEFCVLGKHARTPFLAHTKRRENPLELVHSDLAEANVTSLGGEKYILTFTDDTINYGMVFILANKNMSMVLKAVKEYQAWAKCQSGYVIKEIQTD